VIDNAGIVGPFLIVAHSIGPWISMVYTSRHPDQVVGLVLVDPRGPGVTQRWSEALAEPTPGEPEAVTSLRAFLTGGYEENIEHLAFARSEAIAGALLDADGPFFGDRPVTVLSADGTIDEVLPEPEDLRDALGPTARSTAAASTARPSRAQGRRSPWWREARPHDG
jgi:pimeloyl-ACP methyl ester carboxylesterase